MTETPEEHLERNRIKCKCVYIYPSGDWEWWEEWRDEWRDEKIYQHLMRLVDGEWAELTKGLKCRAVYSYPNGDWAWWDEDDKRHEVKIELDPDSNKDEAPYTPYPATILDRVGTTYVVNSDDEFVQLMEKLGRKL